MRRSLALLVLTTLGVLLTAVPAMAHAGLVETTPSDRSVLDEAPEQVLLRFNEGVTLPTGGLRVFDADANRVDDGTLDLASETPEIIGAELPADLPDGGYIVTWRVISDDSHPVSGVFSFVVGEGEAVDDAVVAELFGSGGGVVGVLGPGLRGLGYVAALLAAGAVYAGAMIARRPDDRRRAMRLASGGAVVAIGATLAAIPVQAIAVTGVGPFGWLSGSVLGEVLLSSFGQSTAIRVVWLVVLLVFATRRVPAVEHALAATAVLGSFLLDGHQRSAEPTWLLMGADAIHLIAGALWFGGLVLLTWLVRSRSIDDDPVGAARLVARFSNIALASFVLVSGAGLAMSWALVRAPRALTSTTYGWTLLVKVGLVVLVVLVAAYNRQRLVPAVAARAVPAGAATDAPSDTDPAELARRPSQDPAVAAIGVEDDAPGLATVRRSRSAWRQLRTTLTIEVGLLVAVLGVTGALVTIQPAAQAAGVTGAAQISAGLTDELEVEVIVDPNEVGLNAIHIYVLDEVGRPSAEVDDLALELTFVPEDVGPFRVDPFFAGTGHWTANIDILTFPGEWQIEVIAGIDRFTEARTSVSVVVNR